MSQNTKLKANAEEQVTRLLTQLADLEAGADGVRSGYHRFFFFVFFFLFPEASIPSLACSLYNNNLRACVHAVYV